MAVVQLTLMTEAGPVARLDQDDGLGPPVRLAGQVQHDGRIVAIRLQQLAMSEGAAVLVKDLRIDGGTDVLGPPTNIRLEKWHDVGSELLLEFPVDVGAGQEVEVWVRSMGGVAGAAVTLVIERD